MIQKSYQTSTRNGIEWTSWFNYSNGTEEECQRLNKEEKWQLKNKLLNRFRYVKD